MNHISCSARWRYWHILPRYPAIFFHKLQLLHEIYIVWMTGWLAGWLQLLHEIYVVWLAGWLTDWDRWTDKWTDWDRPTNGQTDGQMNGWTDGWTEMDVDRWTKMSQIWIKLLETVILSNTLQINYMWRLYLFHKVYP